MYRARALLRASLVGGSAKQRLLMAAAKLIGNDELAARLGVPSWLLVAWIEGAASMPDRKLKALAEVLRELGGPEKS